MVNYVICLACMLHYQNPGTSFSYVFFRIVLFAFLIYTTVHDSWCALAYLLVTSMQLLLSENLEAYFLVIILLVAIMLVGVRHRFSICGATNMPRLLR